MTEVRDYTQELNELSGPLRKLAKASKSIINAPNGDQNNTIYKAALRMFLEADLDDALIIAVLAHAARAGNHPEDRIKKTIDSAFNKAVEQLQQRRDSLKLGVFDDKNATILAKRLFNRVRWIEDHARWCYYEDGCWKMCSDKRILAIVRHTLIDYWTDKLKSASSRSEENEAHSNLKMVSVVSRMTAAMSLLAGEEGFITRQEELDADPFLLNVRNGVLDLRTFELFPHSPDFLLTKQALHEYDPYARDGEWIEHIARFLPDPEVRRQVMRDLGLSIIGTPLDEYFELWIGTGKNGKSTTARIIQGVLGDYATQAAPGLFVKKWGNEHPTGVADLAGRRLVFSSELEDGQALNEQLVKQASGGDIQKARFMRGDYFEFPQTWTNILYANNTPRISGTDEGIWRRIRLIHWNVEIPADERRPQNDVIEDVLGHSGSGVLNWLIAGIMDWRADPTWMAEAVRSETQSYRDDQDWMADYVGEAFELGAGYSELMTTVYNHYKEYCINNGDKTLGKMKFNQALRARGFEDDRGNENKKIWTGFRLRQPDWETAFTALDSESTPSK